VKGCCLILVIINLTISNSTWNFLNYFSSIGENVKYLIDRSDGVYCFRYHLDRVYYCSYVLFWRICLDFICAMFTLYRESLMKKAASINRENLMSFGTCLGKFTKTKKFRLHITALDYLAPYAKVLFRGFSIVIISGYNFPLFSSTKFGWSPVLNRDFCTDTTCWNRVWVGSPMQLPTTRVSLSTVWPIYLW